VTGRISLRDPEYSPISASVRAFGAAVRPLPGRDRGHQDGVVPRSAIATRAVVLPEPHGGTTRPIHREEPSTACWVGPQRPTLRDQRDLMGSPSTYREILGGPAQHTDAESAAFWGGRTVSGGGHRPRGWIFLLCSTSSGWDPQVDRTSPWAGAPAEGGRGATSCRRHRPATRRTGNRLYVMSVLRPAQRRTRRRWRSTARVGHPVGVDVPAMVPVRQTGRSLRHSSNCSWSTSGNASCRSAMKGLVFRPVSHARHSAADATMRSVGSCGSHLRCGRTRTSPDSSWSGSMRWVSRSHRRAKLQPHLLMARDGGAARICAGPRSQLRRTRRVAGLPAFHWRNDSTTREGADRPDPLR
jgi:hypothetical protein